MPDENPYCDVPHPDYIIAIANGTEPPVDTPTVWCRRLKHHDGEHAAYAFLISRRETWPVHDDEGPPF